MSRPACKAVVIGASAGALEALSAILPVLPSGFPVPILVVVHLPPDRDSLLASLLDEKCALTVKEAEDKEILEAGTVYIAPPDYHMHVERDGSISLSADELVLFSRPSIDVLFESAADIYGADLAGVILTGANHDGANGLKAIADKGGVAIVQNPATAHVPIMPQSAINACPRALSLNSGDIALYLKKVTGP